MALSANPCYIADRVEKTRVLRKYESGKDQGIVTSYTASQCCAHRRCATVKPSDLEETIEQLHTACEGHGSNPVPTMCKSVAEEVVWAVALQAMSHVWHHNVCRPVYHVSAAALLLFGSSCITFGQTTSEALAAVLLFDVQFLQVSSRP